MLLLSPGGGGSVETYHISEVLQWCVCVCPESPSRIAPAYGRPLFESTVPVGYCSLSQLWVKKPEAHGAGGLQGWPPLFCEMTLYEMSPGSFAFAMPDPLKEPGVLCMLNSLPKQSP